MNFLFWSVLDLTFRSDLETWTVQVEHSLLMNNQSSIIIIKNVRILSSRSLINKLNSSKWLIVQRISTLVYN